MGRRDLASMGGLRFGFVDGGSFPESLLEVRFADEVGLLVLVLAGDGFEAASRPETTGGGSSRPSAALRESWRAKSDACHHSRNFSAKMEVGRRIFRLESRRG